MKRTSTVLLLVFFVGVSTTAKTQSKSTDAQTPLTAEELKLYSDFLDSFLGTRSGSGPTNLSDRIVSLVLNSGDKDDCLQEIGFKISTASAKTPHLFPASIANGRPVHLVDPNGQDLKHLQAGLLSISEIGFDTDRHFAVFTFELLRPESNGATSREGGTLVFQKSNGKWIRTNRACLGWIT
jgi:hypothetical protein